MISAKGAAGFIFARVCCGALSDVSSQCRSHDSGPHRLHGQALHAASAVAGREHDFGKLGRDFEFYQPTVPEIVPLLVTLTVLPFLRIA